MGSFTATRTYTVELPDEWIETHSDDGTGLVTAAVAAATYKADTGDLDGFVTVEDFPDAPAEWRTAECLPVAYQVDEIGFDYEGTS